MSQDSIPSITCQQHFPFALFYHHEKHLVGTAFIRRAQGDLSGKKLTYRLTDKDGVEKILTSNAACIAHIEKKLGGVS